MGMPCVSIGGLMITVTFFAFSFGKWSSKISPVPMIVTGTTGAPLRIAILKLPPWNGRN